MIAGLARQAAGAALVLVLAAQAARAQSLVGGEFTYTVAAGDTLTSIGARYGTPVRTLARDNSLAAGARLQPGRTLAVVNRHIAADALADGIVVNVPQRMLWLFRERTPELAFPVAAGRPDWRTPVGEFTVVHLQTDKTWSVPASIKE